MKIFRSILLLITIQAISVCQTGWQVQHESIGDEYYDLYFINDLTGWTINTWPPYDLLKTTNKGINWNVIMTSGNHDGTGITFYDEMTGWLCTSSGGVFKSANGGLNWTRSDCGSCGTADDFIDIQYINQNTGWLYGDLRIFKTTNGGLNYFPLICSLTVYNGIFLDSMNGWVAGYGGVARSTNGGLNWSGYAITNEYRIQNIYFANLNTGWCCSFSGKIFKSTDSGANWSVQLTSNNDLLFKIQFVNDNTGWIVGDSGSIYKTTNSGTNWFRQNSPATGRLRGIFMLSATEGWISGEKYILYTTDGGGPIGIQTINTEIPENFSLSQNYPNPFNPSTKIRFSIPIAGQRHAINTIMIIFDVLGREVAFPVNEELKPGIYEIDFDGSQLPSGVYYYRLTSGSFSQTKRMVLLK